VQAALGLLQVIPVEEAHAPQHLQPRKAAGSLAWENLAAIRILIQEGSLMAHLAMPTQTIMDWLLLIYSGANLFWLNHCQVHHLTPKGLRKPKRPFADLGSGF
jgi:hypothetical protein